MVQQSKVYNRPYVQSPIVQILWLLDLLILDILVFRSFGFRPPVLKPYVFRCYVFRRSVRHRFKLFPSEWPLTLPKNPDTQTWPRFGQDFITVEEIELDWLPLPPNWSTLKYTPPNTATTHFKRFFVCWFKLMWQWHIWLQNH